MNNINPLLIEQLLLGVQSHDSNIRKLSESQLNSLSDQYVDEVVTSLMTISVDPNRQVDLRQGALLTLKAVILKSWSIGFDQFTGPPVISAELKFHVRAELLKLIDDGETKIRSAVALLVSKLASVDFPDEWPELLDILQKNLDISENKTDSSTFNLLEGTLTVLNEVLNDALSETEFFRVGPRLLSSLLKVLTLFSSTPADIISWKLCILVVQCFASCVQFFLMAEDSQQEALESAAKEIVNEWSKPFLDILSSSNVISQNNDATNGDTNLTVAIIETKIEVLTAIRELESSFPSFVDSKKLPEFFYPVWTDWTSTATIYYQYSFLCENSRQAINNIIMEQISFLQLCLECNSELRNQLNNSKSFEDLVSTAIANASLSKEAITTWNDDCNEFVTLERDLSLDRSPRTEIVPLLLTTKSPLLLSLVWGSRQEDRHIQLESILYLLDCIIKEVSISHQKMDSTFIPSLIDTVTKIQESTGELSPIDTLVKSRALILGSTITKHFGGRVDPQTVKYRFLTNALQAASSSNTSPILKVSALIALNSFSHTSKNQLKSHQNAIFSSIASLVEEADSDTPAMLVEFLLAAINLDFRAALTNSSSDILQLLFALASKDTANIELVTEVQDMLEEIAQNAAASEQTNHLYSKICSDALPLLLANITKTADGSFNSDLMLSLDLLGSLIDKGPTVLPEVIVNSVIQPLYRIIKISKDSQILQSASEAFTFLVEHGFQQLVNTNLSIDGQSGAGIVLSVASKLLDPSWEDSAALASGRLVSTIIEKFGAHLGDLLPRLLNATARRLVNAENLSLIENLASVFCLLVLQSAEEVVDILSDIQFSDKNNTALEAVLIKWLATFEYVRGYDEIRRNVIALQKLYSLDDPRVKSVIVDGDLESPAGDVIITRSKAKNLRYTQINAPEKIVRLLIKELATTPSGIEGLDTSKMSSMDNEESVDDEDENNWEDEFTGSTVPSSLLREFEGEDINRSVSRQLDTETYSLILEWFKNIAQNNLGDFQSIFNRLSEVEQSILREQLDRA